MNERKFDWYMAISRTESGKYAYVYGLDKGDDIVKFLNHHKEILTMIYCGSHSSAHIACDLQNDNFWLANEIDFDNAKWYGWNRHNFDNDSKERLIKRISSENDSSVRAFLNG